MCSIPPDNPVVTQYDDKVVSIFKKLKEIIQDKLAGNNWRVSFRKVPDLKSKLELSKIKRVV
jgi:hypothetical protein